MPRRRSLVQRRLSRCLKSLVAGNSSVPGPSVAGMNPDRLAGLGCRRRRREDDRLLPTADNLKICMFPGPPTFHSQEIAALLGLFGVAKDVGLHWVHFASLLNQGVNIVTLQQEFRNQRPVFVWHIFNIQKKPSLNTVVSDLTFARWVAPPADKCTRVIVAW